MNVYFLLAGQISWLLVSSTNNLRLHRKPTEQLYQPHQRLTLWLCIGLLCLRLDYGTNPAYHFTNSVCGSQFSPFVECSPQDLWISTATEYCHVCNCKIVGGYETALCWHSWVLYILKLVDQTLTVSAPNPVMCAVCRPCAWCFGMFYCLVCCLRLHAVSACLPS